MLDLKTYGGSPAAFHDLVSGSHPGERRHGYFFLKMKYYLKKKANKQIPEASEADVVMTHLQQCRTSSFPEAGIRITMEEEREAISRRRRRLVYAFKLKFKLRHI